MPSCPTITKKMPTIGWFCSADTSANPKNPIVQIVRSLLTAAVPTKKFSGSFCDAAKSSKRPRRHLPDANSRMSKSGGEAGRYSAIGGPNPAKRRRRQICRLPDAGLFRSQSEHSVFAANKLFYKIFNFSEGFLGRTAVQIQNCLNRKLTALKTPHGVCINIVGSPRNQKA